MLFKKISTHLNDYQRVIIHRHTRPDGDAIGSQIGLKEIIKENFDTEVFVVGDSNKRFEFLGEMDEVSDELFLNALVIVLDTADSALISDTRYQKSPFIIKVDHHIATEDFGNINYVDESFESCASLIAYFAFKENLKINQQAAKALFTGIVTDSGRFRYDSTTDRTFAIAAKLVSIGIDMQTIYNNLYTVELDNVRLRGYFMTNFKVTPKGVAYMKNTHADLEKLEAEFFLVSRGMVNTMAGIEGIDIWVNFTEDVDNSVIVAEIRSSVYNINEVATKYGGGGHKFASGASLENWSVVDAMLNDLDELIKGDG